MTEATNRYAVEFIIGDDVGKIDDRKLGVDQMVFGFLWKFIKVRIKLNILVPGLRCAFVGLC